MVAWEPVTLPVGKNGTFAVRRVFCVGRNYAEHAKEMGHSGREPPFFFGKAAEAVTTAAEVPYPPATKDLHHEVELVVAVGHEAAAITADEARGHIAGYAVGVDLTRRDLQAEAKRLARPWYLAKSWVGAAPLGTLVPVEAAGHPRRGRIWLEVNGAIRQQGDLAEMIWSVDEVLAALSTFDRLLPGDLVFTGTPAGVGPLVPGDRVRAGVDGVGELEFAVTGGT
jgi:fumarylpyruvate hydrolase